MRAMVLEKPGGPLVLRERDRPEPGNGEVLIRVEACAVCRTDLHLLDAELSEIRYPIVPGHEIVGTVTLSGPGASLKPGERVGVAWLAGSCGQCRFCTSQRENLCDNARFTGYHRDGGFADYVLADADYCFALRSRLSDAHAAPLMCAGLIGHRCLRMAGDADRLGLYGFGAAAHIVIQLARHQGRSVYAFTRPGDQSAMDLAMHLGAVWIGGSDQPPPEPLDAAIIFAPVGELVPSALRAVAKGGRVVCGGIHMTDIPSFPYAILWGERSIRSVANLTREDGTTFLELAGRVPIETTIERYPLEEGNRALDALRSGADSEQQTRQSGLEGEWHNVSLRVEINSAEQQGGTSIFEVNEENWEERVGILPIQTIFASDGQYASHHYYLDGTFMFSATGAWSVEDDWITMEQIEPSPVLNRFRFFIDGDLVEFDGMIDWDEDGDEDDRFVGIQRKKTY